jgi:hypothetical protein
MDGGFLTFYFQKCMNEDFENRILYEKKKIGKNIEMAAKN